MLVSLISDVGRSLHVGELLIIINLSAQSEYAIIGFQILHYPRFLFSFRHFKATATLHKLDNELGCLIGNSRWGECLLLNNYYCEKWSKFSMLVIL